MAKTVLAIGAHYDDCVFGIPGVLLQAVKKEYRVVILSLIGDYSNWAPVGTERQNILLEGTRELCSKRGIEIRFLSFKSMHFTVTEQAKRAVSRVVSDLEPEIGFLLWPWDRHPDHEVTSELSKVAFNWAGASLENGPVPRPRKLFYYDNGPRHTIGFEPDTFVNIGPQWSEVVGWLGHLMTLALGEESNASTGAIRAKEALATYRGKTAGVNYAEALKSFNDYPVEIF